MEETGRRSALEAMVFLDRADPAFDGRVHWAAGKESGNGDPGYGPRPGGGHGGGIHQRSGAGRDGRSDDV